jgi:PKD repeat protein/photosystem II stability/assembly factor-like uncharacterized protein
MRLANWAEPRVYPNGNMELASPLKAYNEYQKYVNDNINKTTSVCSANWTSVGPIATNADAPGSIGRVECVGLNPANNNELYVGSTKGGLWKTIDGGVSYVNNTDNFAYLGFSAVAISPSNNSIVYAGTGGIWDGTTLGLVKSIDAGNTWNHITTFPNIRISKILVNPLNAQSITLSSSAGLFKSYNGGLSWISMYTNQDFTDLEYKPNDTTTIYAITDNLFYKSIDGGGSFNTVVSSGITVSGLKNLIAVSQSDPNFVAIATISNSGSAMIYSSNNLGLNFSTNGMTPIVIGSDGNRNAFDVSPLNKLEMMFSGVYTYYTFDGGATVTYAGSSGLHVDTQEIKYSADGSSIYFSTDGGVYKGTSPSSSFVPINGNMNVSQIYSLGVSKTTAGKVVVGLQDNGSWFVNGSSLVWDRFNGGDGMECFFDPNNDNIIYSSSQNGVFYKTINNGVSTNSIMSGLTWGSGGWESPWLFDPNNSNTLFCGLGKNFYKSINAGTSWTLMSTEPSINYFQDIKIAKSNSSTIYACGGATIKSIDGGLTWTNIQNNLPFGFTSSFAINPLNENDVVITFGNKVYRSTTGGASWVDISLGLPNVRCNTVVFDPIPSKGFYVGTDVGVFYYVQSDANYLSFNQGMPFVPVTEIEVDLLGSKLYAATYGRGLWKSDLVDISTCPPIADFTITPTTCGALTVDFINTSVINPTSYSWNFGGGIPATSTATNPSISFTNPGVFSATLTTTNGFGISQMTHTFVVGGSSNIPMTQGFESSSFPPQGWSLSSSVSDGYDWFQHFSYGGFGNTYRSMFFNNWLCNSVGSHHDIVSNEYAVNNVSSLFLNFDVAHHQFSTINDSLIVWVSINCGTSWNRVYAKGSNQLKTALVTSSHPFNPTSSEWRTETVNLNSYVGANSLLLKFTNVNAYGDIIYVDNINLNNSIISGFTKREEDDMFSLFPNPTNGILNIRVKNSNQKCMIYNSVGAIIMMKNEVPEKINLEHLASGIYFIKIGTITQKIIKD